MKREKRFRTAPSINAGTMADVSFLLLLFFLVATAIKNPQGIQVRLPAYDPDSPPPQLNEDHVLTVLLNRSNVVMIEGQLTRSDGISEKVKNHIIERLSIQQQPIVSLTADTGAVYEQYINVYDQIKHAYSALRDQESSRQFDKKFSGLTKEERAIIINTIPMIISETEYID